MIAVAALALFLVKVQFGHSCVEEVQVMICSDIPSYFSPGYLTLVMYVSNVGEINSTVFRSSSLASVTRLRIDSAGVTGIAEGAFGSFQNLTSASLEKNAIREINSNWFGRPAVLSELSLSENQIEVVNESSLDGLINLTKLRLSKNRIRAIDPNSFRSHTNLAELDLSENRMTRVLPQVLRSLRSTRIRLDGNPWDCSCGAEDFVASLKELQSRSLLDRQMEVTCESPPFLRGRLVWNVSVCTTSPTPGPPSVLQSGQSKPTDALVTVPASSETYVTSPSSETETHVPPHTGVTETCVTSEPPSVPSTVCILIIVIVVLCVLLFVVCFLAVQHRRKRNNKTVTPGRPKEEKNKVEEDGRSNRNESAGHSENRDPELAGTRRPFTGVRAKSANAILFMSPFCVSEKDQVTVCNKTRAQSKDTQIQADGKQKVENETEATGIQTENITNITGITERDEKQAAENPHCVSVSTDTVPYLSIGTSQSKTNPDDLKEQPTDSLGQRSQMGRVMGRISTWPPTAIQWQERCRMKEEEEEGNEAQKFPGEVKKTPKKVEHPSVSDQDRKEDEMEKNQMEDLPTAPIQDPLNMRPDQSSNLNDKTTSFSEAHAVADIKQEDPATARRQTITKTQSLNQGKLNQDLRPAENPARKSSSKAEPRHEPKRTVSSRQRADNRSTGSKAPSGGASPDDETLLHGNRYAFMDLLHEVVQNNGRWTRERWKQTHVNKQRR